MSRFRSRKMPGRNLTWVGTGAAIVAAVLMSTATPALAAITISQPTVPTLAPGATGEATFTLDASASDRVGKITFTAPDNTTITRTYYTWNGGPGAISCGLSVDAKTLSCPQSGLAPGFFWSGAATIGVQLTMDPTAPSDTTMTPGVVTNFDENGVQNGQGTYTVKTPPPDLAVTIADSADPAAVGGTYTYTATVTNNGPGAATGVTASTTLSGAASTITAVTSSQGSCAVTAPNILCSLGTLADGASATATVTVRPNAPGVVTATATTTATQTDPNTANNTATQTTTIQAADLDVDVTGQPFLGILVPYLTYTLTAHNNGPDPTSAATTTATLPPGATATNLSAGCTTTTATVTCGYGTIANGASASKTFRIPLSLLSIGPVSVTGTRTASVPGDPNPTNDRATTTCAVISIVLVTCP